MPEAVGIKEVSEAAIGLIDLSAFIVKELRAGKPPLEELMQAFQDLMGNPELKAKLEAAYQGADQIPAELKDFSAAEGLQLAMLVVPEIVKAVGSI